MMRSRTGCLTCRTRKLKCDEQKPRCSQCRKAGRECRLSEAVVFRHQQNASMNQDEGGVGPSSLKGFYSYKNTFGADSVWLDIPKEVVFVDNSDPYADDLDEQFNTDTPLDTHGASTWSHDGGYSLPSSTDAQTHGLDALSAAATAENHPIYQSVMDHIAENTSSTVRIGNAENQEATISSSSPTAARISIAFSPGSPALPLSSPNVNINYVLNSLSNGMPQPIDPSLHSPENQRSGSLVSQGLTQEVVVASAVEAEHEIAFFLRRFSEGPGQWMDVFDNERYFSSQVPVKALSNPLLKYAACACAAKQISRVHVTNAITGGSCLRQAVMKIWPNIESVGWCDYGTRYYEKAIQLLMEELQQDGQSSPVPVSEAYGQLQAEEASGPQNTTSEGRKHSQLPRAYSDDTLTATAILSAYELLDATSSASDKQLNDVKNILDITKAGMVSPERQDPSENMDVTGLTQPRFSKARKAIFWNFVRQDYLSAFLDETRPRLDTSDLALWTEAGLLLDNAGFIQKCSATGQNEYMREGIISNTLIWILSKIVDFLALDDTNNCGESSSSGASQNTPLDRWNRLHTELDAWYKALPDTFKPCSRIDSPPGPHPSPDAFPFQEIWYSMPMCASTMQHYHMACILLLVNKPHESTARRRSIVTDRLNFYRSIEKEIQNHSREICGISAAWPPASARIHSIQPLFVSGQCLTDEVERRAILRILRRIEADLGWATQYRVQQLLKEWDWDEAVLDSISG
ncbi:hypothetical protein MGYG_06143 [Nannizzia gypsea CBS 118893]|uniref:Zn(2)-C6 fungal-type domain-containing protein n=1 Tax=Arthroderma gypseum (strain ATCC MYA-4604 / CBS 118893) TaxID=535722 RepID=E4V0L1_ARTGP|nr:hypothetical protein MGYG_06143 [Nannizzia gypsea CBS 118893]EFR03148.1 hypothetical protein MGYG_06143 [Nannizzia gypsea CBS 118893]